MRPVSSLLSPSPHPLVSQIPPKVDRSTQPNWVPCLIFRLTNRPQSQMPSSNRYRFFWGSCRLILLSPLGMPRAAPHHVSDAKRKVENVCLALPTEEEAGFGRRICPMEATVAVQRRATCRRSKRQAETNILSRHRTVSFPRRTTHSRMLTRHNHPRPLPWKLTTIRLRRPTVLS